MKILFVSAYFPPEVGAPAHRVYELARRWAAKGHWVEVLTGFPNHPTGVVPEPYRRRMARFWMREKIDGITVTRAWLYPAPNRKGWERMVNYSSFALSAGLLGPWLSRPEVVVATSPHLLVGLVGWWLSLLFRAPFVLEIRDLWPESLVASGMGREGSWRIRSLSRLAGFLYRRADLIVTVTEAMARSLSARWKVPADRLALVEHGVDGNRFAPMEQVPWPPPLEDLNGCPVVSYIGTLGKAHGLETLLEAAERLSDQDPPMKFLLIGEGAEKANLMALAEDRGLKNVRFLSAQPWEKIPHCINRSTLCVALLNPAATFETVMPTKILEYMACGKPVALAAAGHCRRVLEESGAGVAVNPGEAGALADAILRLVRDPEGRRRCGEEGRRYVLQRFNLDRQADFYFDLLEERVKRCRSRIS